MEESIEEKRHGLEMPIPYRLELKTNQETIQLFRLKSGKFHVYKYGNEAIYLNGSDYILIKEPLVRFFRLNCKEAIEIKPAEVTQSVTNEKWNGYFEATPKDYLSADTTGHRVELRGVEEDKLEKEWVWKMYGIGLFLSPILCEKFRAEGWSDNFQLYPGLSGLAGFGPRHG